jgi:hypothetical protein
MVRSEEMLKAVVAEECASMARAAATEWPSTLKLCLVTIAAIAPFDFLTTFSKFFTAHIEAIDRATIASSLAIWKRSHATRASSALKQRLGKTV